MTNAVLDKRHRRVASRHRDEQGLTIIELLLSLTILVLLTGFLAGGLTIVRHAFDSSRGAQVRNGVDSAIQAISGLVGSAIPVPAGISDRPAGIVFEGSRDTLSFVGLSEGRSLRGGPYKINFRRAGTDLVVDLMPLVLNAKLDRQRRSPVKTVVLTDVRSVHFSYFGKLNPSSQPVWQTEWRLAEMLPDLVSVQIDFEDERRIEPAVIIALHQG
jgi:general secretion pathway protein J